MRLVPHGQVAQHARDSFVVGSPKESHAVAARSLARKGSKTAATAKFTQASGVACSCAATATCVAWQAARAARARALAAWTSDLLMLRKCGVGSDRVAFAGFGADVLADSFDAAF